MTDKEKAPFADGAAHGNGAETALGDSPIVAQPAAKRNGHLDIEALVDKALDVKPDSRLTDPEKHFDLDDYGNAELVIDRYRDRFVYTSSHGWLTYVTDKGHWSNEFGNAVAKQAVRDALKWRISQAWQNAQGNEGIKQADAITRACKPNAHRVNAIMDALQALATTTVTEFQRDNDHLLNVANGVIDLRTGELLPHSPHYRFMYGIPTPYEPDADATLWNAFLRDAFGDDMADYLQVAAGYSITGYTREEIMFYLFGPTRAGKGTFTEALRATLGGMLVKATGFETFVLQNHPDAQGFALAPLMPARIVFASESSRHRRLDAAKVKNITGGDTLSASFKRRDHFNFRPKFKVWLSSNFPVNADPDDDALWARLRVIPLSNSFLGREDKSLKERLCSPSARPGVLAWLVEGAKRYLRDGLPEIEKVSAATETQRAKLDTIEAWLDENAERDDASREEFASVYANYKAWCEDNGVTPKHRQGLSESLGRKGYKRQRLYDSTQRKKVAYVMNLRLLS